MSGNECLATQEACLYEPEADDRTLMIPSENDQVLQEQSHTNLERDDHETILKYVFKDKTKWKILKCGAQKTRLLLLVTLICVFCVLLILSVMALIKVKSSLSS